MKYRKFNNYEKKEVRAQAIKEAMAGGGLYIYENSSKAAELTLPRPTKSGTRVIPPSGQFQGDDYFMQMVKTGMLRLVEVLQTSEQESQASEELTMNESNLNEEQLILDQPDRVTNSGPTEQVVDPKKKSQLNESNPDQNEEPVLLVEGPVDDGFIIVEE